MSTLRLGCIADDFTGATDLANNLVRAGMRVVQAIGVPSHPLDLDVDSVVIALKSRTAPAKDAVAQSLDALRWLQAHGAEQIYFKYCSTFDSTPDGNIGPVIEALMDAMDGLPNADFTIATPAFPDVHRAVFKGHLFVGDALLHESGMQNHPLTPMTDSNLVRVLQQQCRRKVGLIDYRTVSKGSEAIRERVDALRRQGIGIAIVDAISNRDLMTLAPALKTMPLVTAGSGVAIGLPINFGIVPSDTASELPRSEGFRAIVSGSCSQATNRQVQTFVAGGGRAFRIDALQAASGVDVISHVLSWAEPLLAQGPVLVYSTAEPDAVRSVQSRLGADRAGELLESTLGGVTRGLVELGVRQLIVAGGETSGACIQALDIRQLRIGPQIDPGVPWCHARSGETTQCAMHVALKSGNFGSDDFFVKAFSMLDD